MAGHLAGCTVAKPCPVVKPARTYRKVLTNGKLDGRIGCRYVPKIANEFDRAQILAGAAAVRTFPPTAFGSEGVLELKRIMGSPGGDDSPGKQEGGRHGC